MANRVLIAGAGGTGRELAARLSVQDEVVLVDLEPSAFGDLGPPRPVAEILPELCGSAGLHLVKADATSRLVLSPLLERARKTALVAASERDVVNVEIGRIGRELGFDPIIAVLHDRAFESSYAGERITVVPRASLTADHIQRSIRHSGAVVPVGVGLGKGELVEVRLLRTSPVLGHPLKDLHADRWRIAAIFRGDRLLVPSGDSVLEVDDRVLLVGDPAEMPAIAEHVRQGRPQFPHPYGSSVLTLELGGPDEALLAEARSFSDVCCVSGIVRGLPEGSPAASPRQADREEAPEEEVLALPPLLSPGFAQRIASSHPGILVIRPPQRDRYVHLQFGRAQDARLCDDVASPILYARGTHPLKRILLPVSHSNLNLAAAELAIDLTRQHGASLSTLNVDLPRFLSGVDEENLHEEVEPIRRLCTLYDVPSDYEHRFGNPIRQIVEEARRHDLVVVARRHGRRDTFLDPDIALRVARTAPCSVLVLTVHGVP